MSIDIHKEERLFHLHNGALSYVLFVDGHDVLENLHFGKPLPEGTNLLSLRKVHPLNQQYKEAGEFTTDGDYFEGTANAECSTSGRFDERPASIESLDPRDNTLDFRYEGYCLGSYPKGESAFPYVRQKGEYETLEITLFDKAKSLRLRLYYALHQKEPILLRTMELENVGEKMERFRRIASLTLDKDFEKERLIHFPGTWAKERQRTDEKLSYGLKTLYSLEGRSGHQENPYFMILSEGADLQKGEAYGFNLLWSGNFLEEINVSSFDKLRVNLFAHGLDFALELAPEERFLTSEAVLTYSQRGINGLIQTNHRLVRDSILRKQERRPLIFNSWEGAYMDFDTESILAYMEEAKSIGTELFVLDDGWFGTRNDDRHGLGQWEVNKAKIDLPKVTERAKELGMSFGIWIEPEMINDDTPLYKEHPDWVFHSEGRENAYSRNQLVLDFGRDEVWERIYGDIQKSLQNLPISYIKYDMNRVLSDVASAKNEAGMASYEYTLGVYRFMDRLTKERPSMLFENCASGGGRFDLGMLFYSDRIWASDNTEPDARLLIQEGTSYGYPLMAISSHVSKAPGSWKKKAEIAFFGGYGYEMDPRTLTKETRDLLSHYAELYHRYHRDVIDEGDYAILHSAFEDGHGAYIAMDKDRKEGFLLFARLNGEKAPFQKLPLALLDPESTYRILEETFAGKALLEDGYLLPEDALVDDSALLLIEKI